MKRRRVLAGMVAASATIFLTVYAVPRRRNAEPTELVLSGSAQDMGAQYGERNGRAIRVLLDKYIRRDVLRKNELLIRGRKAQALKVFQGVDKRWRTELEAMTEASGCDKGLLAFGNCFLDLGNAPIGCRTLILKTKIGLFHAHNLDWNDLGGTACYSLQIIRRSPKDRLRTVSLAFPGMIGALDIINEKGIALSFNQLGLGRGVCTEPVFIMMRRIAEDCTTHAEARRAILTAPEGMPFIITLSSATERKGAIFERKRRAITERQLTTQGWATAGNSAHGATSKGRLYATLQEIKPKTLQGAKKYLRHRNVLMPINIYSAIFDFQNNTLHLASGRIPAAPHGYRQYTLFQRAN